MPVEVHNSPPPLHSPPLNEVRPKGILKNPSFSGPTGRSASPERIESNPPSAPLDPQEAKEITLQNTLQNAGHRRSSSAARRSSASRRQSAAINANKNYEDDPDKMRLKWDEANLYLAEQEAGTRMKITEPKTPYQYGSGVMEEDEEEEVGIDPRYVNVDEVEMAKSKNIKRSESDIPGLDIGEPEDESSFPPDEDDARILRRSSMSRDGSKEKHVSVGDAEAYNEQVGMPTREDQEKHRQFEEQRKKHYEMRDIKGLLGHSEDVDMEDGEEASGRAAMSKQLPDRGVNGTR